MVYCIENILCGCNFRPPINVKQDLDLEIVKIMSVAAKCKFDGIPICADFNHPTFKWTMEGTPYIDCKGDYTAAGRILNM